MSMKRPDFFDSPFYDKEKQILKKSAPENMRKEYQQYKRLTSGYVPTLEEIKKLHPTIAITDELIDALKNGKVRILS